jgi:hypothetical protein
MSEPIAWPAFADSSIGIPDLLLYWQALSLYIGLTAKVLKVGLKNPEKA